MAVTKACFSRAFVVGAYIPNGGTYMAYHLGRILQNDFGLEAIAVVVGGEDADNGVQSYDLRMPTLALADLGSTITDDDLLIVNPSFSDYLFGWKLPGFKVSYVQGFSTYTLLDRRFDHYVAVSGFVQRFLQTVYAIEAPVIPAFVHLDKLPPAVPWGSRPRLSVLPYRKGIREIWDVSYERLRRCLYAREPGLVYEDAMLAGNMPQHKLFATIARYRYVLVLSAAEGFPLVPIESMAMGTIVVGYDGFGGRDYLLPGVNCAVSPYPEIEQVADQLLDLLDDPDRGLAMSRRAISTARQYSYEAFRERWTREFARILRLDA